MKLVLLLLFAVALVFWLIKPRSMSQMKEIAKSELENALFEMDMEEISNQLKGPVLSREDEKLVEFFWYKNLEWGDTAKIYLKVYKDILSCDKYDTWWRNFLCFIEPQVTMNYQWNYLSGAISNFESVFSKGTKRIRVISSLDVNNSNNNNFEGNKFELTISPEHLNYLLKRGFFEVLEQDGEITVVAFYEPIANIYLENNENKDTVLVMTAKAVMNDSLELTVVPFNAPKETWN